jgi:hypothetical protein
MSSATQGNPEEGYERRDIQPRPLILFGAGLALLIAGTMIVSGWMDDGLTPTPPEENQYALKPAKVAETTWPVLQSNPYEEIEQHRRTQARRLTLYKWVDRQNGIACIPIERAMTLLVQRNRASSTETGGER